jgi:spore coat protein U-like protein
MSVGLLIGIVLLVTLGNATAGQSMKSLAVRVAVVAPCVVSVVDAIPGNSNALLTWSATAISNLVRGHCGKDTFLRMSIDSGSGTSTVVRDGLTGGNARDNSLYTRSQRALSRDDDKGNNLVNGAGRDLNQKLTVNRQNQSGELHASPDAMSNVIRITIDF